MKIEDQITHILEFFDFDKTLDYLKVKGDAGENLCSKKLKTIASSMLKDVALGGEQKESYCMIAEMTEGFLELSFTPQRVNALDTLFNN